MNFYLVIMRRQHGDGPTVTVDAEHVLADSPAQAAEFALDGARRWDEEVGPPSSRDRRRRNGSGRPSQTGRAMPTSIVPSMAPSIIPGTPDQRGPTLAAHHPARIDEPTMAASGGSMIAHGQSDSRQNNAFDRCSGVGTQQTDHQDDLVERSNCVERLLPATRH